MDTKKNFPFEGPKYHDDIKNTVGISEGKGYHYYYVPYKKSENRRRKPLRRFILYDFLNFPC